MQIMQITLATSKFHSEPVQEYLFVNFLGHQGHVEIINDPEKQSQSCNSLMKSMF